MYDPIERTKRLEEHAFQREKRKYYRFRAAKWYGGIVTGDVTVCNLLCKFCWAGDDIRYHPERVGKFYTPQEAFNRMQGLCKKSGYSLIRMSGQEPTIGREHLIQLLSLIDETRYQFILETNGILLGHDPEYAEDLAKFKNLHVRVSLKGANEEEFSRLTGATSNGFKLQLKALENLNTAGVSCHPSIMCSFSSPESLISLKERLVALDSSIVSRIEIEELILYPHVVARLKKAELGYGAAHRPDNVPKELV